MKNLEFEKTFLAKKLPLGIKKYPHEEIQDIYIPLDFTHPVLRMRQKGNDYEITKKKPIKNDDASEQLEHTIKLEKKEFLSLAKTKGKKIRKIRYFYERQGIKAEVDIFKDNLQGLVLVDFEFDKKVEKDLFKIPDFCLVDVTQDEVFAGGMLCGKKYSDIKEHLQKLGYVRIR